MAGIDLFGAGGNSRGSSYTGILVLCLLRDRGTGPDICALLLRGILLGGSALLAAAKGARALFLLVFGAMAGGDSIWLMST